MSATITARALTEVKRYFEEFPDVAQQAAVLAINDTVNREGMTLIKKDMRDQIDFPSGYLEGGRLKVTRTASKESLEAVIRGRDRATSLARFAPGQTPANTRNSGVRVMVRRGSGKVLRKAFLINLRNGNVGLAIRLPNGQQPNETTAAVAMTSGSKSTLWLLYGPSVDQVFRGVAEQRSDDIAELVYNKFLRQFGRLATRG